MQGVALFGARSQPCFTTHDFLYKFFWVDDEMLKLNVLHGHKSSFIHINTKLLDHKLLGYSKVCRKCKESPCSTLPKGLFDPSRPY